jgi:hypothetical protein
MIACGYTLRWIGFSEDDAGNAEGQEYQAGKPRSQRVEDNAFHLGYFAQ